MDIKCFLECLLKTIISALNWVYLLFSKPFQYSILMYLFNSKLLLFVLYLFSVCYSYIFTFQSTQYFIISSKMQKLKYNLGPFVLHLVVTCITYIYIENQTVFAFNSHVHFA